MLLLVIVVSNDFECCVALDGVGTFHIRKSYGLSRSRHRKDVCFNHLAEGKK